MSPDDAEPADGSDPDGAADGTAAAEVTPARRGVRPRYLAFLALALALLGGSAYLMVHTIRHHDSGIEAGYHRTVSVDGQTITYTIPNGTRARISAGSKVAVLPAKLSVKVGQTLILKNEDTDAHIAGPFFVGPGESSTYKFTEPKVIAGDCTLHPSGHFEIDVVA